MSRIAARAAPVPMRPRHGYTLLELLVGLGIASSLLTLGSTVVASWLPRYYQRAQAEALAQALAHTRAEAIKRGLRVNLCPSVDRATCDRLGRWEQGWIMFADQNHDGDRDPDEPIVRVEPAAGHAVTITGNRPVSGYVSYTSLGHARLASGALQMGTFTVCLPGQPAIDVVLANGGRARLQETTARCP